MTSRNRHSTMLATIGFVVGVCVHSTCANEDQTQSGNDETTRTLTEINSGYKNVDVQIIRWPNELQKEIGKLKEYAFLAVPRMKSSGKMPLLIALHGAGGKAMSLDEQLLRSSKVKGLALAELAGRKLILLEPNSSDSWEPDALDKMLDHVLDHYPEIDRSRVYVMGHSMGGTGTWNWILQSHDRFAAAAPCGFASGADPAEIEKLVNLPIWAMVGGDDGKNVAAIKKMVDQLRAAGNVNVRHTAFPDANHAAGNASVFSSVDWVDWMLTFSQSE